MAALYIPGMRVEIRDDEWRIQRVDRCADGGYLLHCAGLSELVCGRSTQFMTRQGQQMGNAQHVLGDAATELMDDLTGGYRAAQLLIGTALRQTSATNDRIYLGGEAALDIPLSCTLSCAELPQENALGWDDIKHLPAGLVVIRTSPDETLPDAQGNNTVVTRETRYHAPFVKPDRERDYRLVWKVLA